METNPPKPTRLTWDFSDPELLAVIGEANRDALQIISVSMLIE